jgi:hypothetical protein
MPRLHPLQRSLSAAPISDQSRATLPPVGHIKPTQSQMVTKAEGGPQQQLHNSTPTELTGLPQASRVVLWSLTQSKKSHDESRWTWRTVEIACGIQAHLRPLLHGRLDVLGWPTMSRITHSPVGRRRGVQRRLGLTKLKNLSISGIRRGPRHATRSPPAALPRQRRAESLTSVREPLAALKPRAKLLLRYASVSVHSRRPTRTSRLTPFSPSLVEMMGLWLGFFYPADAAASLACVCLECSLNSQAPSEPRL